MKKAYAPSGAIPNTSRHRKPNMLAPAELDGKVLWADGKPLRPFLKGHLLRCFDYYNVHGWPLQSAHSGHAPVGGQARPADGHPLTQKWRSTVVTNCQGAARRPGSKRPASGTKSVRGGLKLPGAAGREPVGHTI